MATFGRAIADEEAGDVAFDEALVEIGEQVGEAHGGPTARAFEYADEGVEYDETGINALDGLVEAGEVCGEREGTSVSCVRRRGWLLDIGENFDTGEVGSESREQLELSRGGIKMRGDNDNACDTHQSLASKDPKVCREIPYISPFHMYL